MKGIIIAGVSSGVGKTTISVALMAALTHKGYRVQPFKVGPDYIDPSYHSSACGFPSRNLDTWLLQPDAVKELFNRAMVGKDIAIIEGVMGLFDGSGGDNDAGSTAELAKLLGLPVVLVIDASKASRSVGAIGLGFKSFDTDINFAGVILNGIAGDTHLQLALPSIKQADLVYFGFFPGKDEFHLPERHLGLIPVSEKKLPNNYYELLAVQACKTLQIDRIIAVTDIKKITTSEQNSLFPATIISCQTAIAIAEDEAFNFYYPDSLDLLRAWGAELIPFSPLNDDAIPKQATGIYIGGGFPELFARELSSNIAMRTSFKTAAERGLVIYAECGGLMYLARCLEDNEGYTYDMAGVLPMKTIMRKHKLSLGYWTLKTRTNNPLLRSGEQVRAHEFHFSCLDETDNKVPVAYDIMEKPGQVEGFVLGNVLAGYMHLHLGSNPVLAPNFVSACTR